MSSILFYNMTIFTGKYNEKIKNACLLVENGKIKQILSFNIDLENRFEHFSILNKDQNNLEEHENNNDLLTNLPNNLSKSKTEFFQTVIDNTSADELIDLEGKFILPGFIDIHMHGYAGIDIITSGDKIHENLAKLAENLALTGTTAFLPTTLTDDLSKIKKVILEVKKFMLSQNVKRTQADTTSNKIEFLQSNETTPNKAYIQRAKVVGLNLEGPYISTAKKGAQNEEFIREIDINEINDLICIGNEVIKIITLAPEKDNAMTAIRLLSDNGIIVSLGHSNCSDEIANEAAINGASLVTHMFNGMSAFGHREPGLVGAGMMNDLLSVELICDGLHIKSDVISFIFKSKAIDKIICITDSLSAAGLKNGEYLLGGLEIVKDGNKIILKKEKSLAGSCLTMDIAFRNAISFTGSQIEEILPAFTINPARIAQIADYKGSIEVGKDADFVVIDQNLNVVKTYISGL